MEIHVFFWKRTPEKKSRSKLNVFSFLFFDSWKFLEKGKLMKTKEMYVFFGENEPRQNFALKVKRVFRRYFFFLWFL